jgi:hypothetical protein
MRQKYPALGYPRHVGLRETTYFIERRPGKRDITYREEAIIKNQTRIVYRDYAVSQVRGLED